jgi:hypothetical protein
VAAHPALPQEVRDPIEKKRATLRPAVWEQATAWARVQTLPALVEGAVAELAAIAQ